LTSHGRILSGETEITLIQHLGIGWTTHFQTPINEKEGMRMKSLARIGVLIALGAMSGTATAHAAPGDWAAVGYDPDGKTGFPGPGITAWVNHAPSKGDAVNAVLSECGSAPGMGGSSAPCTIVALVQNGCVALLSLDGVANPAGGIGPTAQAAVASTAAGKRVTEILYNDCTY
jgi:hypothetical protein